ncbi:MAG TPA: putative lipid II flippase FtsW [Candidatus Omnitrophica bacterium]|nr:putative lipid II flippase FtsW [Candidatus Omnitrophota bacterium]
MRSTRISIFVITLMLIGIGVVMIYSASSIPMWQSTGESAGLLKKQLFYVLVGFFAMFAAMAVDYHRLRKIVKPLFLIAVIPLVLVITPGISREVGGAKRWLHAFGFNYQPSEFVKIALIVYLADFITRKKHLVKDFMRGFLPPMMVLGLVTLLVLLQPDLGTAVSLVVLVFSMLFVSGARPIHLVSSILSALPFLYILVFSVPYRRARILAFLNPWLDPKGSGFQIIQSQIAIGSGGFFGVGLGQGKQKLFYLPAAHTDFIFSIIGEELGLIGTSAVILLFIALIWKMSSIVYNVRDPFGKLICVGVLTLIAFSAAVNIGVSIGSFPTKGLPLPFISYGGSSLIFHMAAIGLLLNVSKQEDAAL